MRLGGHQRCRAAVREKKEAEQLREVRGLSKMQRAKFQIKDQNAASGSEWTMWRASLSALIAA